jgi:hypothetical protein
MVKTGHFARRSDADIVIRLAAGPDRKRHRRGLYSERHEIAPLG